jgi:RNA polymerase sigma-70 factor (ECF subfamily)
MLISQDARHAAVRHAADRLETAERRSRYRRRHAGRRPAATERATAAAITGAREADEDALRLLYLLYADDVYSVVLGVLRHPHDAEDVTSEVFARLPRALARYSPGTAPFAAWLRRVARNAALDHIRGQRAVPVAEVYAADAVTEDPRPERLDALRSALKTLPTDQRRVVLLRFVAGLTPAEVAHELGRSEDAVHALQHRARRRLSSDLAAMGASPDARVRRAA